MAGNNGLNGYRTKPLYTFSEAAHLADVSIPTVKNWLYGYGDRPPLFATVTERKEAMVSFLQLIEIVVAARFRKAENTKFETVRLAHKNAQEIFEVEYPFAHMQLRALGGHIVYHIRGQKPDVSLQALDSPEQWTMPGLVQQEIQRFEYDSVFGFVEKWHPQGKDIPIMIDPQISTGLPTIRNRGVTIQAVYDRFMARNPIDFIAKDLKLSPEQIEEAIRYADKVAV